MGSSESTLVKMPHCWKSHVPAQMEKILTTDLFLFLKEILVIRTGIHKMHVRIINREEPDQAASCNLCLHNLVWPFFTDN